MILDLPTCHVRQFLPLGVILDLPTLKLDIINGRSLNLRALHENLCLDTVSGMLWFKNEQSYDSVIFFCPLVSLNFQREVFCIHET